MNGIYSRKYVVMIKWKFLNINGVFQILIIFSINSLYEYIYIIHIEMWIIQYKYNNPPESNDV